MSKRIIFYYQAYMSLDSLLSKNTPITHLHLGAINFDLDINRIATIYLNDYKPFDIIYYNVWNDIEYAAKLGIKIILTIGGTAGTFTKLFDNFDKYYNCLCLLIRGKALFSGVELNIKDACPLNNIRYLICRLIADFGEDFLISITARQEYLETDYPDKCAFIYRDLLNTSQGKYINYLNSQFFLDYTLDAYDDVIDNGYPSEKLIMGMKAYEDISDLPKIIKKYGDKFGGVCLYERLNENIMFSDIIKDIDKFLNYYDYHAVDNINEINGLGEDEINGLGEYEINGLGEDELNNKKYPSCEIL